MRIRYIVIILLSLGFKSAFAFQSGARISPRNANYTIEVILNAENKRLYGHQRISWTNISNVPAKELYFHLYWNAFSNNLTTMAFENGGQLPGDPIHTVNRGGVEITKLNIFNGPDILQNLNFVAPDDNNPFDKTVAKVDLPGNVNPGETIEIELDFMASIPGTMKRAGYSGDFFFNAQWFPKLGVFENGNWNCHQYHRFSEFYADYGTYSVSITVPERFVIGATGELRNKVRNGGTTTYTYFQEDVHDFAWTAYPDFDELTSEYVTSSGRNIIITLLLPSEISSQYDRYFHSVKAAFKHFEEWLDEYPYSTLTIVDAPRLADDVNGMEYPTLITGGTHWLAPKRFLQPESVVIHEFGHQYWYGLIGSNEFESPWLDEGITSYYQAKILDKEYGDDQKIFRIASIPFYGKPLVNYNNNPIVSYWGNVPLPQKFKRLEGYNTELTAMPTAFKAWGHLDAQSYSSSVYSKPSLMLQTFENLIGEDRFLSILRSFYNTWKFRHPATHDFVNHFNRETSNQWAELLNELLYGTGTIDYAIEEAASRIMDESNRIDAASDSSQVFLNSVTIRRNGEIILPVEIAMIYANNDTVNYSWDGEDSWNKIETQSSSKLVKVEIDSQNKLLLDTDYSNNSLYLEPDRSSVLRWSNKWLFWMQNFLHLIALIG